MAMDDDMQTFRRKTITNGDRIRSMTDDELADFLIEDNPCKNKFCNGMTCKQCMLEWIQKEAKP